VNGVREYRGGGRNDENTKKLMNRIFVGYIERISVSNTECYFICLHFVVLVQMNY
jgi:hypothetical protein